MDTTVWQKFNAAAQDYDQASTLQQQAAQHLLNLVGNVALNSVWLDAGCGTGVLAKTLATRGARVWAIDLAPNMLKNLEAYERIQTIQADIAQLPLPNDMLDGIVSNFALHWLGSNCLPELLRVLQPNKDAWLAIPVQGSLAEVSERYSNFPVFGFEPVQHWLDRAAEHVVFYDVKQFSKPYPHLKALLAALRQMGGDQTGQAAIRPDVSVWRHWLQDATPIDLSFNVLFLHLRKTTTHHALSFLYE